MSTAAAFDTAIVFTERMEKLAGFYRAALALGEPNLRPGQMGSSVGLSTWDLTRGRRHWDRRLLRPGPEALG